MRRFFAGLLPLVCLLLTACAEPPTGELAPVDVYLPPETEVRGDAPAERTLTLDGETYCCGYAELGNPGIPHLTVEIPDLLLRIDDEEALGALRMLGRKLRYHPALPKGANVNFYQVTGPQHLRQLTYERGVEDFTLACGTGAGSLAAVLTASGRMDGANVQVQTAGGDLDVEVEMEAGRVENLYLTGAALIVYSGELAEEFLQPVVIENIMD